MKRTGAGCALALLLVMCWGAQVPAQEDLLAPARERLEDTAFEDALSAIDAVLAREGLDAEVRVEARVLRAQALVALGDLKKAEAEWEAILLERPGFRPDPEGVPAKAMKRFEALRAAKVGSVRLDLDPRDATLALDGKPVQRDADGTLSVLAGTHTLRAERPGFDAGEATLAVGPGGALDLVLHLSPNARTVVVQAEPAGAEVLLDGKPVGRAQVPAEGGPPVLVLSDVPLGDHAFEVRLPCHRTVHVDEALAVDLLDTAPRRLPPIRLESAKGTLTPTGLDGASLAVDGEVLGTLPLAPVDACAGERRLTATRDGRRLWVGTVEVRDGEEVAPALDARPNLVVVGVEAPDWADSWNVEAGEGELAQAWPADVDLVLGREGAWSPWLQARVSVDGDPLLQGPPGRTRATVGVGLADGGPFGAARVVRLRPDGPAARAGVRLGERIVAVGSKRVASAQEAEAAVAVAPGASLALELDGGPGGARRVTVELERSPLLLPPPQGAGPAALRAAWAAAQAGARPDDLAAAADLPRALAAGGRAEAAAERWRALRWPDRTGIGEGTVAYFLGRALQAVGRDADAAKALAAAASSQATAESDDGPPIAPAAASRP